MKRKMNEKRKGARPQRAEARPRRRTGVLSAAHRPPMRQASRKRASLALGVLEGTRRGFGFVRLENGGADVFVPARHLEGALDGDTVRVAVTREGERPEGEIREVLKRARMSAVGTVVSDEDIGLYPEGECYLLPDNPRLPAFPLSRRIRARVGDKIEITIPYDGVARLLNHFGRATSRAANYAAILAELGVPTEFSAECLAEAEAVAAEEISPEGRRLVRGAVLTIDSESAKDLDDAISLSRRGEGYLLSVHIADVSHYVRPGTALDAAAHARGSSVYFTDRVVPMLPEALSNGACSLNAREEKYALTCEMTLDGEGNIVKTKLYNSIIKSRVRGVYSEINALMEEGEASPHYKKYRTVYPMLCEMFSLYRLLAEGSRRRGILTLETAEAVILLDEEGSPAEIRRAERGEAERLIEAFMLCANRAVAEELTRRGFPCVYRIHEPPPAEKYGELCEYLTALSLPHPWRKNEEPTSAALSRLLDKAGERGLLGQVSMTVLRSLSKARYDAAPSPHFGLALPLYCHFTSPIRRLSDLVTHRIIKAVLIGGAPAAKYRAAARRGAEAATEGEVRAVTAERRIEALYKTLYMQRFVGECFEGQVSSVTSHGYYVELDNTCEGLVPTSLLDGEWAYDSRHRTLASGERRVSLGDRVTIRVREADVTTQHILFEPIEDQ